MGLFYERGLFSHSDLYSPWIQSPSLMQNSLRVNKLLFHSHPQKCLQDITHFYRITRKETRTPFTDLQAEFRARNSDSELFCRLDVLIFSQTPHKQISFRISLFFFTEKKNKTSRSFSVDSKIQSTHEKQILRKLRERRQALKRV